MCVCECVCVCVFVCARVIESVTELSTGQACFRPAVRDRLLTSATGVCKTRAATWDLAPVKMISIEIVLVIVV